MSLTNKQKIIFVLLLICFILIIFNLTKHKNQITLSDIGGPKVILKESKVKLDTKDTEHKKELKPIKENNIKILSTNDENIKSAWIDSQWIPTKTKQTGEHSINFEENSLDRIEMKETFSDVLKVEESLIEEWWIDSIEETQIYAYLSNKETNKPYKIYLKWINNSGWKAEKVEELYFLPNNY